jgi:hypothetical protein
MNLSMNLSRRSFLLGTGATLVATASPLNIVGVGSDFSQYTVVRPDLYAELAAITREAFLPRIYAQIYRPPPFNFDWTSSE